MAICVPLLFFTLLALLLVEPSFSTERRGLRPQNAEVANSRTLRNDYFLDIDLKEVSLCGCSSCYDKGDSGYQTRSGDHTCPQRIMDLIVTNDMSEKDACRKVVDEAYGDECAICDPTLCDAAASRVVAPSDESAEMTGTFTTSSSVKDPLPDKTFCGCAFCGHEAWLKMAGEFSCGARISYLEEKGLSEKQACETVAGNEFPEFCGLCNPAACEPSDNLLGEGQNFVQDNNNQPLGNAIPLSPEFPLYCYPGYKQRTRYEKVWGKYTLEVKESKTACGPSDNIFSTNTVQVEKDELTLQFKKVGDQWEASEVRVLLPNKEMPYHYGNYSFSVKSIRVIDIANGNTVDTVLPPTMILGLFTWDATEDYGTHENYNHEVDVEIARWDIEEQADVQFLVQPPGDPHKYRFFSGNGEQKYDQAPHRYSFEWRPAEIEWTSSAGGGDQTFIYNTQMALDARQPDYTQCMPADVEVRINLWHLFGNSAPKGMQETSMVEVVIDDFQFTPNGLVALTDGFTCSKHCQCSKDSLCQENRCTYVEPNANVYAASNTKPYPYGAPGEDNGEHNNWNVQVVPEGGDPIVLANQQGFEKTSGGGKRVKTGGKVMLTLLFMMVAAVAGVLFVRIRRKQKPLCPLVCGASQGDLDEKVVVECWEVGTANVEDTASFEMSIRT